MAPGSVSGSIGISPQSHPAACYIINKSQTFCTADSTHFHHNLPVINHSSTQSLTPNDTPRAPFHYARGTKFGVDGQVTAALPR